MELHTTAWDCMQLYGIFWRKRKSAIANELFTFVVKGLFPFQRRKENQSLIFLNVQHTSKVAAAFQHCSFQTLLNLAIAKRQ